MLDFAQKWKYKEGNLNEESGEGKNQLYLIIHCSYERGLLIREEEEWDYE